MLCIIVFLKVLYFFERKHKEKIEEGDQSKGPLAVFGNDLKNKNHAKFKGLRHGVSERVYRQLSLRGRLVELMLFVIDEHNTSKMKIHTCEYHTSINTIFYFCILETCNSCFQNNLKNLKCGNGDEEHKIHQILICERCNIYWNRDDMATKNMFIIAQSIWNGNGRPHVF